MGNALFAVAFPAGRPFLHAERLGFCVPFTLYINGVFAAWVASGPPRDGFYARSHFAQELTGVRLWASVDSAVQCYRALFAPYINEVFATWLVSGRCV